MSSSHLHSVPRLLKRLLLVCLGSRSFSLILMSVILVINAGCTRTVHVKDGGIESAQESNDYFNTHVVVQSPTLKSSDIQSKGGFFAVGILNKWDIDFASALPTAVADALSHNFKNVTVEDHYRRGCSGCGMIIRPKIIDFALNKVTMSTTLKIQLRVYDAHEQLIATFEHEGNSGFLSVARTGAIGVTFAIPLVNNLVGGPVMKGSVQGALTDALIDMQERFKAESKEGGILARVWRPEKKSFGEHEYTAELLARKLGCKMNTDGLNLVSQEYGKEEYDAYCWDVGVFTISCELGRCGIDSDHVLAFQKN